MRTQGLHPQFQSGFVSAMPLAGYVWLLGSQTRLDPWTGNLLKNTPLIESLVKHKQAVIAPLSQMLAQSYSRLQILEGLFLAQRLAEVKAPGVKTLYAAAARFNYTTDPLIQVYLAGFYRKLNVPESFGPLVEMLLRQSQQPQNTAFQTGLNPMEEVGGAVLQLLAEKSAEEVLKRLEEPKRR